MKPKHLLTLACLICLACLLISPAAAAVTDATGKTYRTYDQIYASSLSSGDKLALVQEMAGWTPELEAYLEWKNTQQYYVSNESVDNTTTEDGGLLDGIGKAFENLLGGGNKQPVVGELEVVEEEPLYTEEEQAAFEGQYAAYQRNFAANYAATAAYTGSGSGTAADPYIITTPAELQAMADDLDAYYKLGNDIDLSSLSDSWQSIGIYSAPFQGDFNGNGYKIYNFNPTFSPSGSGYNYVGGIFGCVGTNGYIYNLYVDGILTVSSDTNGISVGFIAGNCMGEISNCIVSGEIISSPLDAISTTDSYRWLGGIAGTIAKGNINNCISNVVISGGYIRATVGGLIVGQSYIIPSTSPSGDSGEIINCVSYGSISITGSNPYTPKFTSSGGIIGRIEIPMTISNNIVMASSISSSTNPGRIYGSSSSTQTISNCYALETMLVNNNIVSGGTSSNNKGANVDAATAATQTFYKDTLGWDFANTWYWDEAENLPKLQVFRAIPPTITSITATPSIGGQQDTYTLSVSASTTAAGGIASYQWYGKIGSSGTWNAISGATSATYTFTPGDQFLGDVYFRCVITGADGGVIDSWDAGFTNIKIIVVLAPQITSPAATPASGPLSQTVQLSASVTSTETVTYQWQELISGTWTAISGATAATATVNIADSAATTHSYRLLATNVGGTSTSATVTYTSVAPPTISGATANPTTGPLTQSVTLSASVSGATSYQWQELKSGTWTNIAGKTAATVTVSIADSTATTHSYRLIATNIGGSSTSNTITYQSVPAPQVTAITATPNTGPLSQSVQLSVTATGTGISYQWQELIGSNWQALSGKTSATVTVSVNDAEPTLHTYRAVITNIGGSVNSNTVTYQSSKGPEIVAVSANPTIGPYTQTVTLSATATSDYTIAYQWQELIGSNWQALSGKTSATVTVSISDTQATTHTYRLMATDIGGTVYSDTVTYLSVAPPTISAVSASPTSGPLTQTVTLSVTAQSTQTATYQWQERFSGTWVNIDGATTATYRITISDGQPTLHTYRVIVTNVGGTATSGEVTYQSVAAPTISTVTANPTTGPLTQTVTLSASVTGATSYQWQEQIGGSWQNIAGKTSASVTVNVADNVATTHTYRLQATNIGGTTTSTTVTYASVAVPVISSVTANPTTGPLSQSVQLSATVTGATSYQWQQLSGSTWSNIAGATGATYTVNIADSAATLHSYRVIVTNIGGTATSAAVTYQSVVPPTISVVSASPTTGPLTQSVQLSASVTGATSYQWQELKSGSWTNIAGATATTYTANIQDSTATTHSYRILATNIGGTTTSNTVTYSSLNPPTISAITASPTTGPFTQAVTLSATISGATSYQWQELKSGSWTNIAGATATTYTVNINDNAATLHSYRIVASNTGGTTTSNTVTYQSVAPPTISAVSANPSTGPFTQSVQLSATVTGATSYLWQELSGSWQNIPGATSATYTVSISDSAATTHSYRVLVTNIGGTTTSNTVTYTSIAPPVVSSVTANPTTGPLSQSVQLSATVSGATSYQWQQLSGSTWQNIAGATAATYMVNIADSAATLHSYRVIVSNIGGTVTSATVTYQSVVPPTISAVSASPTTGPLSQSVQLSATISGATSYQWQELKSGSWTNIAGATGTTYSVIVRDTIGTTHTYRIQATNIGGTTSSETVTYTSIALPVVSGVSIDPSVGRYSETITLAAVVSGADSYQWQINSGNGWTDLLGATTNPWVGELTFTSSTTQFRMVALNGGGTTNSDTITYTVAGSAVVQSVSASPSIVSLPGSTTLKISGTNIDTVTWEKLGSTSWETVGTGLSLPQSLTTEGSHTYRAVILGLDGRTTTSENIVVLAGYAPTASITAPADGASFPGKTQIPLSATITGTDVIYRWDFDSVRNTNGGNTNPTWVIYDVDGQYTITLRAESIFGSASDSITIVSGVMPRPQAQTTLEAVSIAPVEAFVQSFNVPQGEIIDVPNVLGAVTAPISDLMPDGMFLVIIFGVIFIMLWLMTKNTAVPSIIGLLFGGSILVLLPGSYYGAAIAILAISIVGGLIRVFLPPK